MPRYREWATSFEYRLVSSPDEEVLDDDFVSLSMLNVKKEWLNSPSTEPGAAQSHAPRAAAGFGSVSYSLASAWRSRHDITLLIVGASQAPFGLVIYVERFHIH